MYYMIEKKTPIKQNVVVLFIILFLFFILIPIPYYQSEIVSCKMGQTCPKAGWYWGKSITQLINYSLKNTSKVESVNVDENNGSATEGKFCGGFAGVACPEGFFCKLDGKYPDAGGTCIKK